MKLDVKLGIWKISLDAGFKFLYVIPSSNVVSPCSGLLIYGLRSFLSFYLLKALLSNVDSMKAETGATVLFSLKVLGVDYSVF